MANIYEFEVTKEVVEELTRDIGLTISSEAKGNVVDNLMIAALDSPITFLETLMNGKPGYYVRVGHIVTERFEGRGLHMYTHSGSEGFLDTLEFDRRLRSSLLRQNIPFIDRTQPDTE